jgi:RNA polymerase sigma-70 factor (ECF subfamily)
MTAIRDAWTQAREAWPGVDVSFDEFERWVTERAGGEDPAALDMHDLYLACACHRGDPAALAAFDSCFANTIDAALASVRMRDEHGDEIRQRLRSKLFVGERARIASYTGRGALGGWVRAAAIREAIDVRRQNRREVPADDPLAALEAMPLEDPALAALKQQYREPMKAAFSAALAGLSAEDRMLLRYKYVDGATLDDIAAIQRVHRATIARRFRDLREDVAARTRDHLVAALGVGVGDAASIIRLVQSQIDASLSGLAD